MNCVSICCRRAVSAAAVVLPSVHEYCISAQRVSNSVAEGGGTKYMYIYKNFIFQSPLIVHDSFGQLSMIFMELFLCLGSYLTVNI